MLIHTAKKVGTAMHVEHDPFAFLSTGIPLCMIPPHFNPLSLQCAVISSPLPPLLSSNFVDAMMSQLSSYSFCCSRYALLRYGDFINFHPVWIRDPLRGESLYILDFVVRGVVEKLTNEVDTLMI